MTLKASANRPRVRWCWAAKRFWYWMHSGPWCFYEAGKRGSGAAGHWLAQHLIPSPARDLLRAPRTSGKVLRFPSVAQDEMLRSMIILENLTKSFGARSVLNGV